MGAGKVGGDLQSDMVAYHLAVTNKTVQCEDQEDDVLIVATTVAGIITIPSDMLHV